MENITFTDEIYNALLAYLREDCPDEEDRALIEAEYRAAVSFCVGYTGQSVEYILGNEIFRPAIFCLVADMHDVRAYSVQNDKVNPVAAQILGMHSVNLL